ncbi:hypothetical protein BASA81_018333 [Batrachochytrium salamandrivorans]|nr:hypothetical protein BASA81_018333 [Batrachochytrium salamandrivorans]
MALASTINNVGDGIVGFYEDAEKAGQRLRGDAGDLLANWPSHSVWTSTSNSEITTQIAGSAHSIRGVENVYTWLRGGVLNGEADLDQRWLDGTVEHESMGTRHDNRALAARLADFLQVA